MKITITFNVEPEEYGWSEHGKPYGLSQQDYVRETCKQMLVGGADFPDSEIRLLVEDGRSTMVEKVTVKQLREA